MENRVMYLTLGISFTVFVILVVGLTNLSDYLELKEERDYVESVKMKQAELDEQFLELQKTKKEYVESLNRTLMDADEDEDGLSFAQELQLGTSDYLSDSDLDGVPDATDPNPAGGGKTHTQTVEWYHNGDKITSQFGVPNDRYEWYKAKDRMPATSPEYVTYEDLTMKNIAEDLSDLSDIMNEECKYCLIVNFVQSMLYQFDVDYIGLDEYPKFPIETLVDRRGDCEDTSYLLATLYKALDVDAVLVLLPGHMATAVACDDCSGVYYELNGKKYYYVETTASGWNIGQIPEQFENFNARLVEI